LVSASEMDGGRRLGASSRIRPSATFTSAHARPSASSSSHCMSRGESGFAYTEQWAKRQNFPPNLDRLIHRYQLPPEIVPGWRMMGSIMIPESSLSERSSAESKKVQRWEVPNTGFAMTYQIFVSSSDDSTGPVVIGSRQGQSAGIVGGRRKTVGVPAPVRSRRAAWARRRVGASGRAHRGRPRPPV